MGLSSQAGSDICVRGLFKRAILQSGVGGFSPSYHHFNELRAAKYGSLAAAELGCLKLDMAETADCLREKSVFSLLAVDLVNQLMSHPSIDRGHTGDQAYLPREPQYLLADGDYATDVDILLGFDEDESVIGTQIFLPAPDLFIVVRELWSIVGPYALLQKHTSEITEQDIKLTKEILDFYCGPLEQLDQTTDFDNISKMLTDSFFWFGAHRFLDLHLKHATGNTFFYRNKYLVRIMILFIYLNRKCSGRIAQYLGSGSGQCSLPLGWTLRRTLSPVGSFLGRGIHAEPERSPDVAEDDDHVDQLCQVR